VHVDASTEHAAATMRVDDSQAGAAGTDVSLAEGANTIEIEVTAEDGVTTALYTVTITRQGAALFAQDAYVKASNTEAGDSFGQPVVLSGDTLAVGAAAEDSAATGVGGDETDNTAVNAGAVYVFTRDGAGVWSQQAYLKASNAEGGDDFGWSVALSDDTLAVGAPDESSAATGIDGDEADNTAISTQRRATRSAPPSRSRATRSLRVRSGRRAPRPASAATRPTTQRLMPVPPTCSCATAPQPGRSRPTSRPRTRTQSISSVSLSRWRATRSRSAPTWSPAPRSASAATRPTTRLNFPGPFMCSRVDSASVWSQQAYVKASNTDADDLFGWYIALSRDTLAAGAILESSAATGIGGDEADNTANSAGAVYVFD
jgi:ethanolamine utilization microcompartment shell protein EutS